MTRKFAGATPELVFGNAGDAAFQRYGVKQLSVGNASFPTAFNIICDNTLWPFVMWDTGVPANPFFYIDINGKLNWGPKTAAADANLYRLSAQNLKTDSNFYSGLTFVSSGTGGATGFLFNPPASAIGYAFANTIQGESQARFAIDGNGSMSWGPGGSTARDTSFYRFNTAQLYTPGGLLWAGPSYYYPTAAGSTAIYSLVQGESQPRFRLDGSGAQYWGPGGSTPVDTNLYRISANQLGTDGTFTSNLGAAGTTAFQAPLLASSGYFAAVRQGGDSQWRFLIDCNGSFQWGPGGSTGVDTSLQRGGVAMLTVSNNLWAYGSLVSFLGNVNQVYLTNPGGNPGIFFGNANDTYISRTAVNTLQVNNNLVATGTIDGDMHQYTGDWAAGSYLDGDIAVVNGVAYLCVRPTSAAPSAWTPAPPQTAYGTGLPTNPVDGQEAILVDSVTNPSYQWKFRYNAGSTSAYKWEFIGGTSVYAEITTSETTTATVYSALTTAGPTITLPRAGDYEVEIGAYMGNANANVQAWMSYDIGATGAVDADALTVQENSSAGNVLANIARARRKTGLTAVALTAKYKCGSGGVTGSFASRWMRVTPVRVS